MGYNFLTINLVSILAAVYCEADNLPATKLRGCRLKGDVYAVGEAFYPVIRADGAYYTSVCTKCTCSQVIPQCERVSCPPLNCKSPVRTDGQCCAVCPPENEEGHSDPSQCIFNGLLIKHGRAFHPSLLNPQPGDTSNPYCTSCNCSNGYIECKNHSLECPILNCEEPATLPGGTCCPVCPAPSVTAPVQATKAPVCRDFDGRTFFEGEQWHPSYPNYGLVTCINCTCVNSKSECVKLPCPVPKQPLPPCGPDEPDIVLCCPTCSRVPLTTTASGQPPISTTTSETTAKVTITVMLETCPKPYSIKAWKDRQRDALALEDISIGAASGSRVLTIWSWQSVNGSYSYTITTKTVTNAQLTTSYNFVGWTKPARVRRLTTATKQQKIDRCSSNCHSVLSQLLRVRQDCDGDH